MILFFYEYNCRAEETLTQDLQSYIDKPQEYIHIYYVRYFIPSKLKVILTVLLFINLVILAYYILNACDPFQLFVGDRASQTLYVFSFPCSMLSGLERADPSDWYKYIFPSALIASYFLACAIALLCKKRKRLYWKITAALGVLAIFCCIQWGYAYISVQRLRNRQLDTLRQIDVPITLPNPLPTAARIPVILHHN